VGVPQRDLDKSALRSTPTYMQIQTLSYARGRGWSEAIDVANDSPGTLVLAFGASSFATDVQPFQDLRRALPNAQLIGCSTAGEIHGTKVHDDSIAVAIVRFEHTSVAAASADVVATNDSFRAGLTIGKALAGPALRAVFLLSNGAGVGVNGSELVSGINEIVGGAAVVTGGLAGDGNRFERTWVLHNDVPRPDVVAAVGLYGDRLRFGHGSKGGWDIFGPERVVTHSEGNVLFELDGRPALQLYKQYLGDRANGLPATGLLFPLALRANSASEKRLVRTILAIDEATQSLTFAGDIPQGSLAQLMRANFDRLVEGASGAAAMIRQHEAVGPVLSIAISCVGRRLVLGQRVEEETEAVLDTLPAGTKQVGFYSYGEISPYTDGTCDLHNQTMTLTTVAEV
jgi:hypothetical protein